MSQVSLILLKTKEPGHEKMCLMSYANNKGTDQPAHSRSLISAFVVHCLYSIIFLESIAEISKLWLASVAAQASLCLGWSETPEDTFSHDMVQIKQETKRAKTFKKDLKPECDSFTPHNQTFMECPRARTGNDGMICQWPLGFGHYHFGGLDPGPRSSDNRCSAQSYGFYCF